MLVLCEFNKVFLKMTWKWLNDPEIKQLTNSADFTIEDQKKWFNGLKNKQDYKIWGLTYHKKPVGVCGIKNITQNDCEYWGYIGEKEYWGRGFGSAILEYMEYEARKLILRSI
jgi:RimJ/RimL family protein N-acetyltransferase